MTATQRPSSGGRKLLVDLIFTLIIPISILSPNLLGSGISFTDMLGSAVTAYVVAALIPVGYTLFDLLVNRNVSPVAIFAGATALITGALAFWYVDGALYAFKDSLTRLLIAAFAVASVFFRYPLFRIFLDASSVTAKPEERRALDTVMADSTVVRALGTGTLVFAGMELVAAIVNFVANLQIVTAGFDTKEFNAQVARANAVMRVPSIVLFLAGFSLALYIVQRAVKARFGQKANILEPQQLAEQLQKTE